MNTSAGYQQARIDTTTSVLLLLSSDIEFKNANQKILDTFCGQVVCFDENNDELNEDTLAYKTVYLGGDLTRMNSSLEKALARARRVELVGQMSTFGVDREEAPAFYRKWPIIDVGRVPRVLHKVAVYMPRFFEGNPQGEFFDAVTDFARKAIPR